MLEVRNLTRRYGEFTAVDDVSFSVRPGEIVGLLGHNGAGKTTIMKMVSGYLEPDTGQILLDGADAIDHPARLQRTLGYLPETLPMYPELSVAEYLDYAAQLKGLSDDARLSAIRRAIEATELGEKLLAPIGTLSRGFRQRTGVAQAILGEPSLLILDEPTNGLDPAQTEQMRQLIRDLSQQATVVLSTHIMQEVEALCDRALMMRQGQLAVDAPLASLTRCDTLRLDTNASLESVNKAIGSLPGMVSVTAMNGLHRLPEVRSEEPGDRSDTCVEDQGTCPAAYAITLQQSTSAHAAIAGIARALVNADIDVMGIHADTRTLQSLFMEVNDTQARRVEGESTSQEVNHAA